MSSGIAVVRRFLVEENQPGFGLPQPWQSIVDVGLKKMAILDGQRQKRWAAVTYELLAIAIKDIEGYYWRTGRTAANWASPFVNSATCYANVTFRLKRGGWRRLGISPWMVVVVVGILLACAQEVEDIEGVAGQRWIDL